MKSIDLFMTRSGSGSAAATRGRRDGAPIRNRRSSNDTRRRPS